MSIQVENNLKNNNNREEFENRTHYIPCKIDSDGEAKVQKYFETNIVEDGNGGLKASFRGYPLDGVKMKLPPGYQAIIATEAKRPLAENADRRFQVAGGFKEFVHWNWDKKTSKNDNIVKALDWIDIAEASTGSEDIGGVLWRCQNDDVPAAPQLYLVYYNTYRKSDHTMIQSIFLQPPQAKIQL